MASLFGPSPEEIMLARQQQMQEQQMMRQQQIAQQGQQFGIFAPLYQAGLQLGDLGTQAAMQSLFPQQADPALQRATAVQGVLAKYQGENLQDPEVLSKIASDLMAVSPEAGLKAADLASKFTKDRKLTTVAPGASLVNERGEVVFTAPDRTEDPLKTASRDKFEEIYAKYPDTPEGRARAAVEFRNWDNTFKERVQAASNVPGQLKITDVTAARNIAEDIYGADKKKLNTVGEIKTYIAQARQGNPKAVPQLQRSLVKLVGDNQIGQNEVKQALGSSGFAQNVIESVNKFLTGLPTDLSLNQVEQAVEALENYYGTRFNKGRQSAVSLLEDTKTPKSTIDKIVGNPYTTASQKRNSQFVEGKIYVDAKGNRARFVDGKFQPVK